MQDSSDGVGGNGGAEGLGDSGGEATEATDAEVSELDEQISEQYQEQTPNGIEMEESDLDWTEQPTQYRAGIENSQQSFEDRMADERFATEHEDRLLEREGNERFQQELNDYAEAAKAEDYKSAEHWDRRADGILPPESQQELKDIEARRDALRERLDRMQ